MFLRNRLLRSSPSFDDIWQFSRLRRKKRPEVAAWRNLNLKRRNWALKVLNVAQYGVNRLAPNLRSALLAAGHQLHISETERMYLDGGASMKNVVNNILSAIDGFSAATEHVVAGK